MTDSIIFDLDGTLWDSTESVAKSWNITMGFDFVTAQDISGIMGKTSAEIANALFSQFEDKAREKCLACLAGECRDLPTLGGHIYPGVEDMLKTLAAKYPLFIVSNCEKGYIEAFLAYSGFDKYITGHLCEGDTGLNKADNISLIAKNYGLAAPVYVGDTRLDEESARKAGCAFIHAAYGFGTALSPDASVISAAHIADKIERL